MSSTGPSLPRRPALGLAGGVAIAVVAVLAALAANLGLLGAAPSAAGKVGQLDGNNVASLVSSAEGGATASDPATGSGSGSGSITPTISGEPDVDSGVKDADDQHAEPPTGTDSRTSGDNDD